MTQERFTTTDGQVLQKNPTCPPAPSYAADAREP
jgi:hypothetical protein